MRMSEEREAEIRRLAQDPAYAQGCLITREHRVESALSEVLEELAECRREFRLLKFGPMLPGVVRD